MTPLSGSPMSAIEKREEAGLSFRDAWREDRWLLGSIVVLWNVAVVYILAFDPAMIGASWYAVVLLYLLDLIVVAVPSLLIWAVRAGLLVLTDRVLRWYTQRQEARSAALAEAQRLAAERAAAKTEHDLDVMFCECPYNRFHCMLGVCVIAASRRFAELEPSRPPHQEHPRV